MSVYIHPKGRCVPMSHAGLLFQLSTDVRNLRELARVAIAPGCAPTPTQPLSNFVLVDVAITFLAVALARQRGFDSLLLTRLQIESVSLHFPNDVLLHNFALEPPERVLKSFTVLNVDLGQRSAPFLNGEK